MTTRRKTLEQKLRNRHFWNKIVPGIFAGMVLLTCFLVWYIGIVGWLQR